MAWCMFQRLRAEILIWSGNGPYIFEAILIMAHIRQTYPGHELYVTLFFVTSI